MPHAGRMVYLRICFCLDSITVISYKRSFRNRVNICNAPLCSVFSIKYLRVDLATVRCVLNFFFLLWHIISNGVFLPWRNPEPFFEFIIIINSGSMLKERFLQILQTQLLTGSYVSAAHMERWKFFVKRHKVLLEAEM